MHKVLVVDDNDIDREHIRRLLGSDYEIIEAATVQAAGTCLEAGGVECVLLDHRLPDGDGIGLLATLVERRLPVLMLTAQGNEQLAVQALKGGARDYIAKSKLAPELLRRSVAHAIERSRLELELHAHQQRLAASNQALAEREAQLRVVLSQLPAIVWTTTLDLRYASVDGAALSTLGLSGAQLVGADVRGGVPGAAADSANDDVEALHGHRRAAAGESARYTCGARGRVYQCLVEPLRGEGGASCGTIGVALDITEARRLEAELRHSQKMEAVGMLAGGIAHNFNNLLTTILGFAGFMSEALPAEGAVRDDLEQVVAAGSRARKLVNQLLAFSHKQPVEPRIIAVNAVLMEMTAMLRQLLGADIELRLSLSEAAWNVRIDPSGLEQVIVNLAINARDAMPGGGRLTLATENRGAPADLALQGGEAHPGECVVILVSDTGAGIAPDVLDRIFEPFFTTKGVGRGTGLGLSTCHGIVAQAGGALSVRSLLGAGTTFSVHLPRVYEAVDRHSIPPAENVRGGRELVLVVEDDDQVRAVIVRTLLGLGYETLEASSGRQALDVLARPAKPIDLVLTDVVMPELGGLELADRLRRERPEVRVLLMSAHEDAALRAGTALPQHSRILLKPVTSDSLATKVRAALDSGNLSLAGQ
jgi:two-component system, cell cycle sensor histidine kinase and response regulator CckA